MSEQLTQPPGRGRDEGGSERVFRSFVFPILGRLSTFYLEPNRSGPDQITK